MLRIGNVTGTFNPNVTDKERLVLSTVSQSNMIILNTQDENKQINIVLNDDMTIGRYENTINFTSNSINLMAISATETVYNAPTYFNNEVIINSNLNINIANIAIDGSGINAPNVISCNVSILYPSDAQTFFTIQQADANSGINNPTYLQVNQGTITFLGGNLGIGTIAPEEQLHITENMQIDGNLSVPNINTNYISYQYNNNTKSNVINLNATFKDNYNNNVQGISFDNTNVYVQGVLRAPNFALKDINLLTATVTSNANLANTYIHNNSSNRANIPTLYIDHSNAFNNCNVIDVFINKNSIMSLDNKGCISFGKNALSNARATMDISYNNSNNVSNMFIVSGISPTNVFVVDNSANVGIGTDTPIHPIHITRLNEDITNNAFIGIYDNTLPDPDTNNGYGSIFMACNIASNVQVAYLDKFGSLTLGVLDYDPTWTLNVAKSMNVPFIQTSAIYPNNNISSTIDFGNAGFCNVTGVSLQNANILQLTTTSNLTTNYFSACNFAIKGLNIFNDTIPQYFEITNANYVFSGTAACFSTNLGDLQSDPINQGKLKIITEDAPNLQSRSVGINVIGNKSTSIRVTSTVYGDSVFENFGINGYRSYSGIGTDGIYFLSYGNSDSDYYNNRAFQISGNGIRLSKNVQITNSGLSINNGGNDINPTAFTQKLLVKGVTQVNDVQNNPVLFVNDGSAYANTNVGIGTNIPNAKLHVIGNAIFTDDTYLMNNAIIACNVGIGTTYPRNTLDVCGVATFSSNVVISSNLSITNALFVGNTATVNNQLFVNSDIFCTGNLYQGVGTGVQGQINISSQWITGTNLGSITVYSTGSNIGIGTSLPSNQLHVFGGSTFSVNKPGTTFPLTIPSSSIINSVTTLTGTFNAINFTITSSSGTNLINLFNKSVSTTSTSWNITGYSTTTNLYTDASLFTPSSRGNIIGHWISLSLTTPINLNTIGINCDTNFRGPSEVVILASNDTINWAYIGVYTFSTWDNRHVNIATPAIINISTFGLYSNYRIVFTKSFGVGNNQIRLQEITYTYGINNNLYIDNAGIGIGTSQPRQGLDLTDVNIIVNTSSSNTSSNVTAGIGIGTNIPQYPLHVLGGACFQNGNVGIGKTIVPAFTLDVGGNINFDGGLYEKGYRYISSQWINGTDATFYSIGCNIGIGTTTPTHTLDVYGDTYFQQGNVGIGKTQSAFTLDVGGNINFDGGLYQSGYRYVSSQWVTGIDGVNFYSIGCNIGIGTTTPTHILDVYGDTYFQQGNVGIGKTQATFTLDVGGNINFDGGLYEKGYRYISSQWISGNNGTSNTIYSTGCNIGIGTTNPNSQYTLQVFGRTNFATGNVGIGKTQTPSFTLDVTGDINFSGSLYNNGFKQTNSQWFSVASNTFSNIYSISNVGIGTSFPEQPLHVLGRTFLACNVGIATPVTNNYTLDVGGNVNFSGNLSQRGINWVSSQWTSVASNTFSNIYSSSNVGIGTNNPLYPLHVVGNVFIGSNLNVKGMITATKNIATTSDLRVKTDLQKISNPLEILNHLNGYKYRRTDINTYEYGLIAQEVQQVLPEIVGSHNDLLNISYANMSAIFVEAIKVLTDKIKILESEIEELKKTPMET